jgi:preprotein translocase subunit YajC
MPLVHLILDAIILAVLIFIIILQRKSRKLDKEIEGMMKKTFGGK